MCGLCLPYCPTYAATGNEAESPRGRISLMTALASGALEPSEPLTDHLEHCLVCRACEAKCPSGVRYGKLIDTHRINAAATRPTTTKPDAAQTLATHPKLRRRAGFALWLSERLGLRAAGRSLGLVRALGLTRYERMTPRLQRPTKWRSYYPAAAPSKGDVALFTGCFSELFDNQTLRSSITLLNRLGYGVHVPRNQTCCGALHWHQGDAPQAQHLAKTNLDAFASLNVNAIVGTASGCASHLRDYGQVIENGETLAHRVTDISTFLNDIDWPDTLQLRALHKRVAVHDPCSLANVLKQSQAPYALLDKIPGLAVTPLPGNQHCCGSAGRYMVTHPDMAERIRQPKLDALTALKPDILVTSNIGCAMHLLDGIRRNGLAIDVMHPVTLLARQLSR